MNKGQFSKLIVVIFSTILIYGCTWVKLGTDGYDVRVAGEDEVANCQLKGSTTVNLKATIAGFDRSNKKVKSELQTLGRNSAGNIGGDTIVADSDIKKGKQTFKVYDCAGKTS